MDMAGDGIGVLDFDPICQCQDNDGLVMQVVSLHQNGSVATAKVNNRFGREVHVVRFRLSKTGSRWLLADVVTRRQPSLLKDLEKANLNLKVR
jgi:hypothetical protein